MPFVNNYQVHFSGGRIEVKQIKVNDKLKLREPNAAELQIAFYSYAEMALFDPVYKGQGGWFQEGVLCYYLAAIGPNLFNADAARKKLNVDVAQHVGLTEDNNNLKLHAYHVCMLERMNRGRVFNFDKLHEVLRLADELEDDAQKEGLNPELYQKKLGGPHHIGIHQATYKLNSRLTAAQKTQIQTKRTELQNTTDSAEQAHQIKIANEILTWKLTDPNFLLAKSAFNNNLAAVVKLFLADQTLTVQQKQQVLLNTLLDGAYMCKPANKAVVDAAFDLLKSTNHPNGGKWADVLTVALPQAVAEKATAFAKQLADEDAYDKKWPWRRADPNKVKKQQALSGISEACKKLEVVPAPVVSLNPDALKLDEKGSSNAVGIEEKADGVRKNMPEAVTEILAAAVNDKAVITGNGWGYFTSWGSATGSRTEDFLRAAIQAAEGLVRPERRFIVQERPVLEGFAYVAPNDKPIVRTIAPVPRN